MRNAAFKINPLQTTLFTSADIIRQKDQKRVNWIIWILGGIHYHFQLTPTVPPKPNVPNTSQDSIAKH